MKNLKDVIQEKAHYTTSLGHCDMEYIKSINIKIPSLEDQEKIVKQMGQYDNLVELQKQQIDSIDLIAKERLEFHLKKCIDSAKIVTNDEIKISDKVDINLEEKSFILSSTVLLEDLEDFSSISSSKVKKSKLNVVL